MAALSANNPYAASSVLRSVKYKVKGTTHIYQGAQVCIDASGYLNPAADTSGLIYVGQSTEEVNNTGADGAVTCSVIPPQAGDKFLIVNIASPVYTTHVGKHVFWLDDQTCALAAGTSNDIIGGRIIEIVTTGTVGQVKVDTTDLFTRSTTA